jgi:hypothetical protein
MNPPDHLNQWLDRLARPRVWLGQRARSSFRVCGVTGYMFAVLLTSLLTRHQGLSVAVLFGIAMAGALTFLALALITKIIMGRETLIYYHHEIAVMLVVALALWLARQPVLPYLDVTILGLGAFLACGRIGCFMVGCCHGRPHRFGVCYQREHADEGFPSWYVRVRLFPIQLVESGLVLLIVLVGSSLILARAEPGAALGWYLVAYGVMRFILEFSRGDAGRPYWLGFSEAQWTSLILMNAAVLAQWLGFLQLHPWHALATLLMAAWMVGIVLKRRYRPDPAFELLRPAHMREIAVLARSTVSPESEAEHSRGTRTTKPIAVGSTSKGLRISSSRIEESGQSIDHFALSRKPQRLDGKLAGALAELICRLRMAPGPQELVTRNQGVYHLLIRDPAPQPAMRTFLSATGARNAHIPVRNVNVSKAHKYH